jgi:hypothetical protein
MKISHVECLWPYGPDSDRPIAQMDVVVDLEDGSRWLTSFHDTHRFNQGVKGFRGLGPDRPWRVGPRLVIVRELTESTIRNTVEAVLAAGEFQEAFERVS